MFILGLTGSIGMGKTAVATHMAARGVPVLDSDSVVHRLYSGDAVPHIETAFPGTTAAGSVDRAKLSAALLAEDGGFARLEALVHPLVRRAQWQFLQAQEAAGAPLAVLDIPLLFETGGDTLMDASLVVSAPPDVQAARVLQRPGMTQAKLDAIRARQLPDAEKRARADFVVDTGVEWEATRLQVDKLLESLVARPGTAMERWRKLYA
jgi:dephospho-CoA kinase